MNHFFLSPFSSGLLAVFKAVRVNVQTVDPRDEAEGSFLLDTLAPN